MEQLEKLISRQSEIDSQMEQLEEEKYVLGQKILEATKDLAREQLLNIYPQIKNSEVKYQLFLKIKNNEA